MHLSFKLIALAALTLPLAAQAHKMWLLPSATTVAGNDPWISVDAAISNDLFHADHVAGNLAQLRIVAPDGSAVQPQHAQTGKYRSVFDLPLAQQGTYRIAMVSHGVMASYELGGEKKRWRGDAAALAGAVPAGATKVATSEMVNRVETFVSNGKPSHGALKPGGVGLELMPVSEPTGLVEGEPATFQLLLDGRPAASVDVTAIRGATRYRNAPEDMHTHTDADGRFSFTWPQPGMYWVNASVADSRSSVPQVTARRANYSATLEVLPE